MNDHYCIECDGNGQDGPPPLCDECTKSAWDFVEKSGLPAYLSEVREDARRPVGVELLRLCPTCAASVELDIEQRGVECALLRVRLYLEGHDGWDNDEHLAFLSVYEMMYALDFLGTAMLSPWASDSTEVLGHAWSVLAREHARRRECLDVVRLARELAQDGLGRIERAAATGSLRTLDVGPPLDAVLAAARGRLTNRGER